MIKVYRSWNEELEKEWRFLQRSTKTHPQSYIDWVKSWSDFRVKGRKKLNILFLETESGKCIAPFVRENIYGFVVLTTIPHHFGDRYDFIALGNKRKLYEDIFDYLLTYESWNFVHLRNILEKSLLFSVLEERKFPILEVGKQIVGYIDEESFDGYVQKLRRKVRSEYRRRWKKLKEQGKVEVIFSTNYEDYLAWESVFIKIQTARSISARRHVVDIDTYNYRRAALEGLHVYGIPLYTVIKLDDRIIAYRIGLLDSDNGYHDFKLSYCPEYGTFGLGGILNAELIRYLIEKGVKSINHGMGDYSYKKNWSTGYDELSSYDVALASSGLRSRLYLAWVTKWKQVLSVRYNELVKK